eukprot:jgi/Chlat1/5815/Chrsp4S06285
MPHAVAMSWAAPAAATAPTMPLWWCTPTLTTITTRQTTMTTARATLENHASTSSSSGADQPPAAPAFRVVLKQPKPTSETSDKAVKARQQQQRASVSLQPALTRQYFLSRAESLLQLAGSQTMQSPSQTPIKSQRGYGSDPLKEMTLLIQEIGKSRLPSAEKSATALAVLQLAVASGKANSVHVGAIVGVCTRVSNLDASKQALDIARTANVPLNSRMYTPFLKALCDTGRHKEALLQLDRLLLEGVTPDTVLFNALLDGGFGLADMQQIWSKMETAGVCLDERSYSAIMRCHGHAGNITQVQYLWNEMLHRGIRPTPFTFNSLIRVYAQLGQVDSIRKAMHKMRSNGLAPDTYTYNLMLKAHAHARDYAAAMSSFKEMERSGVRLDTVTFNTVLDICVGANQFRLVDNIRQLMRRYQVQADGFTYAGYARNSTKLVKVLELMDKEQCHHDHVSLRTALFACIRCGEAGLALKMQQRMITEGHPPPLPITDILLMCADAAVTKGFLDALADDRLPAFMSEMASAGVACTPVATERAISEALERHGLAKTVDAMEAFQRAAAGAIDDDKTWRAVVRHINATDRTSAALVADFAERVLAVQAASRRPPDTALFAALISACIRCGRTDTALALHRKAQTSEESMSTLSVDGTERILLDTMEHAMLGAIMRVPGNDDDSDALMKEMEAAGVRPKSQAISGAIKQLMAGVEPKKAAGVADGYANHDEVGVDDAQDAVQPAKLRSPPVWAAPPAGQSADMPPELLRALALVEAMPRLVGTRPNGFVYGALMQACLRHGQVERVNALWHQMRSEGLQLNIVLWTIRLQCLAALGQLNGQAQEVLAAVEADGVKPDAKFMRCLLNLCMKAGDSRGAACVTTRMSQMGTVPPADGTAHPSRPAQRAVGGVPSCWPAWPA